MRLLPLIGLVSLAGLAVASPVIGREASKDASATPPRRLVVYTQLNYTGTPYEIHAEKDCVQFVAPVYKNMKSFKVAHQVCYFMDEDACGGKALVIVDALGAEAWANTDDGTDFSTRITSVYCEDHSMRPPSSDTAVVKRDGPGETTVCRSTMNIGPCVTLSANRACVYFGNELRHNIRNVYQAYGSICNYYYDDNCNVPTPVMTVNTHKQALHVQLDKQTGDRLAYVKCQDYWSVEDTQGDDVHIFPRADDVHDPIEKATDIIQTRSTTGVVSRTEDTSLKIIDVIICSRKDFAGDCTHLSSDTCWLLPPKIAHSAASWSQSEHLQCTFFAGPLCSDVLWQVNTGFKRFTANTSTRISDLTVAIRCDPTGATQSEAEANIGILSPTENREVYTPLKRVDVTVCAGPDVTGSCMQLNAKWCWIMLPKSAVSIRQSENLVCTLWSTQDCTGSLWSLTTGFTYRAVNIPPEATERTVAIKCVSTDAQSALETSTELLAPAVKRESDAFLKVDGILCTGENTTGQCPSVEASQCYILQGTYLGARSWLQSDNLVCKFWAGTNCERDEIWSLTTDFTYKMVNLPRMVSQRMKAIRCVPVSAQAAPEAHTAQLQPAAKRETDNSLRVNGNLCAGEYATGKCINVEGFGACVITGASGGAKPRSWLQSERLTCTFYSGGCKGRGIWTLSTDFIYKVVNLPLVVSHLVHAIRCDPVDDQSTSEGDTAQLQPTRRGTDTALKVDGTLCTGEDSTGQCFNVDGGRCSIMAGNELLRSWSQSERLVCTIFSWAKTGCDGDGIWSLTTDFTYKVVNLPLVISRQGHAISCVPSNGPEPGIAGQVLVSDDDGFGGKTQLVDLVKDDDNCAPLSEDISWSLKSLIQYEGAVCNYWNHSTVDCGKSLPGHKPVFTIDSLGGQIGLSPIPDVFGGAYSHHIRSISCMNGKAAADYMAALDPSEKVIDIETPGVAKKTAFSTGPHDGQLAARTESTTDDYFEPLALYHDPDRGGAVMTYVGPSCGLNPFGVDPIKSLWQIQGFLCQFYPAWGCQETNGPPLWINSVDGPCYNRNVEFPILSVSCTRSTHDDSIEGPDATQLIEYEAESTPAVLAPGTINPVLATRTDAANTFTPLRFCTGENLTGACFSYTGPDCASGDPAIFEMKSLVVDKDFQCVFMSGLNCNEGYPHYVDARQDENRINSIDWIVKSIYCKPEPWHG